MISAVVSSSVAHCSRLIDWGLMALSAQIGYINKYVAVKKVKLMRKLTILCVGNTCNKQLQ